MKKALIVVLALALLFSLIPQTVFADDGCNQQMWYVHSDQDYNPGWTNYIMFRSPTGEALDAEEDKTYIEVGNGNSVVWRSDEIAETTFIFGAGDWDGKITMNNHSSYDLNNITVRIGYVDVNGFHDDFGETTIANAKFGGNSWEIRYKFLASSFTVPKDCYLAFQLENGTGRLIKVGVNFTQNWLKSPCDDPGYPTPELPTLAFLAIGLVFLGGYMIFRRRSLANDS
jgi:hypothetical protein